MHQKKQVWAAMPTILTLSFTRLFSLDQRSCLSRHASPENHGQFPPPTLLRHRDWLLYAGVVALVAYGGFSSVGRLGLNTHALDIFSDNEALGEDLSLLFAGHGEKAFASGRPGADLARWVTYLIAGNDASSFHVSVAVGHAAASFLLALTAAHLAAPALVAQVAGLLFVASVAHSQAVHDMTAIDYPLALIWTSLALLCFARYESCRRGGWLAGFCFLYVLAVLTHPATVVLVLFPLFALWARRRLTLRYAALFIPAAILGAAAAVLSTHWAEASSSQDLLFAEAAQQSLGSSIAGWFLSLWWLSSRFVTTAYWLAVPLYETQSWEFYLGFGVVVALVLTAVHRGPYAIWAAWTLLFLAPFVVLPEEIVFGWPTGQSRYLYFAAGGSCLLLAALLHAGSLSLRRVYPRLGHVSLLATVAVLLLLGCIHLRKVESVTDYIGARYLFATGDEQSAVGYMRRAIDEGGDVIPIEDAHWRHATPTLGTAAGDSLLRLAVERYPTSTDLNLMLGVVESTTPDSAIEQQGWRRLQLCHDLAAKGGLAENFVYQAGAAYLNMGLNFERGLDLERAAWAYRRSLRVREHNDKTMRALARALSRLKRWQEASAVYSSVADLFEQSDRIPEAAAMRDSARVTTRRSVHAAGTTD